MGAFYSHAVFQPPDPATYTDDQGIYYFKRARDPMKSERPLADVEFVRHYLVFLRTTLGSTIPGAYFHHRNSYYTILFSHGNGEDLGMSSTYALELSNVLQTSVFTYDYSGYGLADGKASESNCYADIRAAYTYLISERRIPPQRIILFGRSLGSGPTIDLAVALGGTCVGVVIVGGIMSCVRVVLGNLPNTLKFDMFPNIDKIGKILAPIFVVHGEADDVVPFEHGMELHRNARYPLDPLWVKDANHNNLEGHKYQHLVFSRYVQVMKEFRTWEKPQSSDVIDKTRNRGARGVSKVIASCLRSSVSHSKSQSDNDGLSQKANASESPYPKNTFYRVSHKLGWGIGRLKRTRSDDLLSLSDRDEGDFSEMFKYSRPSSTTLPKPKSNGRRPSSHI